MIFVKKIIKIIKGSVVSVILGSGITVLVFCYDNLFLMSFFKPPSLSKIISKKFLSTSSSHHWFTITWFITRMTRENDVFKIKFSKIFLTKKLVKYDFPKFEIRFFFGRKFTVLAQKYDSFGPKLRQFWVGQFWVGHFWVGLGQYYFDWDCTGN